MSNDLESAAAPRRNGLQRWWDVLAAHLAAGWRRVFAKPGPDTRGARYAATALACVALLLTLLQSMLYVASGWGVEDFLGWAEPGPADAMLELWRQIHVIGAAGAYLAIDTLMFVPVYTAFFATLALLLTDGIAPGTLREGASPAEPSRAAAVLLGVLAAPLLALIVADLAENGLGLTRIPEFGWGAAAATSIFGLAFLAKVGTLNVMLGRLSRWALAGAAVLLLALLATGWLQGKTCDLSAAAQLMDWLGPFACAAHRAKQWLTLLLILAMLVAGGAWLFGMRLNRAGDDAALRESRARLRAAIGDMLLRSRYVLLAIAALAGLTVAMDQGRDVVYAVAAAPFRNTSDWGHWAGATLVFGASMIAVWLMVFACWLWTRSVCQLRAVHEPVPPASDPGQRRSCCGVPAGPDAANALRPEDYFARDWARVLAMLPLLVLILLCAGVVQDSVIAQSAADKTMRASSHGMAIVRVVLGFGVITLLLGLLFIRLRRGKEETRYYDALSWTEWRERAGFAATGADKQKHRQALREKYSLGGIVNPYWLPIVAIAGMLACRLIGVAVGPIDPAGHIPTMTLPIIMFALALWLCFFGWLSLLEVRQSIPWLGLLIVLMGALGLMGLTDNHLVWPAIDGGKAEPFGALHMLLFTTLLAALLVGLYMWVMHLVKIMSGRGTGVTASGRARRIALWAPPPVLLALLVGVIALADHTATSRKPQPNAKEAARHDLDRTLADWLASLCGAKAGTDACDSTGFGTAGDYDVFFVSTEGGGIRAAAWTALVLQHFDKTVPQFQARTFSISGVSGGAIGAAVFRACNTDQSGEAAKACVERFAQTDLLAPLLAAWMFEDALARVVPTRWCTTPACGFLSRGAVGSPGTELEFAL